MLLDELLASARAAVAVDGYCLISCRATKERRGAAYDDDEHRLFCSFVADAASRFPQYFTDGDGVSFPQNDHLPVAWMEVTDPYAVHELMAFQGIRYEGLHVEWRVHPPLGVQPIEELLVQTSPAGQCHFVLGPAMAERPPPDLNRRPRG